MTSQTLLNEGDKARVVACTEPKHYFKMGQVVAISRERDRLGDYQAENIDDSTIWYWINERDLEPILVLDTFDPSDGIEDPEELTRA